MGKSYPAMYRAADGAWYGFAARARVILVNTKLIEPEAMPRSIHDLADSKYKGRTGIAKPLFGTTATHATCLFEKLGPQGAKEFFKQLKANEVQVLAGNKTAARSVSAGQLAFCLTDTDDAILEIDAGHPVAIVYPDQHDGGMGTLFIPNTLALIKGGPNREHAEKLIEYLLSPKIEARLAQGPSAQIPLHPDVTEKPRGQIATPNTIRAMQIDFGKAAEHWDEAAEYLRQEFASGG